MQTCMNMELIKLLFQLCFNLVHVATVLGQWSRTEHFRAGLYSLLPWNVFYDWCKIIKRYSWLKGDGRNSEKSGNKVILQFSLVLDNQINLVSCVDKLLSNHRIKKTLNLNAIQVEILIFFFQDIWRDYKWEKESPCAF